MTLAMSSGHTAQRLTREAFRTSRLLEYFSEKELTLQTGHEPDRWPAVILKELLDNSLDACEDAGVLPDITITVTGDRVTVEDNGPGLPAAVIEGILDFTVRVSTKDAYISPTRGAQGNALKTVLAIPYVLGDGAAQMVTVESHGQAHAITLALDRIAQTPEIRHVIKASSVKTGTRVTVPVPSLERAAVDDLDDEDEDDAREQDDDTPATWGSLVEGYSLFNPHARFTLIVDGAVQSFDRTTTTIAKWRPSDPTSPHWYTPAQLRGLMAAYVTAERNGGKALTVRDFIAQFKGLSGTQKRKAILARLPRLAAMPLSACVSRGDIDMTAVTALLTAMCAESKPINPLALGVLGQGHLQTWLAAHGGVGATITYRRMAGVDDTSGLPFVFEFAFGARQDRDPRRVLVGINAAPTLSDPFRTLKGYGIGLDGLLHAQFIRADVPVTCVAHLSCPHLRYTDRGKSSLEAV